MASSVATPLGKCSRLFCAALQPRESLRELWGWRVTGTLEAFVFGLPLLTSVRMDGLLQSASNANDLTNNFNIGPVAKPQKLRQSRATGTNSQNAVRSA